jgi:long-chain acyl-CoA synthetase
MSGGGVLYNGIIVERGADLTTFAAKLARARPDQIAIRDEHQALTWADLDEVLNRATNGLLALDLGPDRRVAVFGENAVETAMANLSGLLAGASVVPVNFHLTAEETAYILADADVRVLFVDAMTAARGVAAAAEAGVHTLIGWGDDLPAGVTPWRDWLAAQSAANPPSDHPPRPNLLYTSGTTGRPKGTPLPPTMFAGGATVAEHLENLKLSPMAAFGPHLVVGPMYHTGPLSGARLLAAGVPSVILGRFDAEKTLAAIERYQIGNTVMVPTHFVRLLALPDTVRAQYDPSSLQRVSHTGAKCPIDVKRAMIDWWGPVFVDAYGASEVGTTCMITSEEWLQHPGSVGRAVPPFEALVLDEDGNPLPTGQEGRLYFCDTTGRGIIYHNAPEKTAEAHIAPGVFTLGEIAYMDAEGYVYITDRFSDMIVSGGANIYPAEAEQILIHHPGVLDVACIGVPHREMGEELKALVIARDSLNPPDPRELIDWCRARLSHYKCPRSVDYVDDLGRNTMGKINKRTLRAPYWPA